ncbi:hypothetical protein [Massilia yuzhufengensis]|uniref:Uncharacterized protein n=1 Tax=Massilia yuzhufengensis TaxID=1164594 RepID=A0A1I1T1K8_9BURK|nr:hypothetical protein [Massilia yuzhufengensis]SFD52532.1 hypothetical protein SAMN05216204_12751 [Massilia yuzhufengensis]
MKTSTKARDLGLMALASAVGVFIGLGIAEVLLALLAQAGYAPGAGETPWLRIIVLALCVGTVQRVAMRRFGIKM